MPQGIYCTVVFGKNFDLTFDRVDDFFDKAIAAFVNYCSFAGKPELVQAVLGGLWNASQIDLVTRIRKVG